MFPEPESSAHPPKLEIFNPSGHPLPFRRELIPKLIRAIETGEQVRFSNLEIVFIDEAGISRINSQFLDKNYITDIISFRYDEDDSNKEIEGTLYCCAPRIEEQSQEFGTGPEEEFLRIIAHGALHLTGYDDQNESEKERMTNLENSYLTKTTNQK